MYEINKLIQFYRQLQLVLQTRHHYFRKEMELNLICNSSEIG